MKTIYYDDRQIALMVRFALFFDNDFAKTHKLSAAHVDLVTAGKVAPNAALLRFQACRIAWSIPAG